MTSLVLSCDWSRDQRALAVYPNASDFFTDVIHVFCFALMVLKKGTDTNFQSLFQPLP